MSPHESSRQEEELETRFRFAFASFFIRLKKKEVRRPIASFTKEFLNDQLTTVVSTFSARAAADDLQAVVTRTFEELCLDGS